MLELLGVGIQAPDGRWLTRGVSARIDAPAVIAVTGASADARMALLDAVAGRHVAAEGRVWVGGVPVVRGARSRVRGRVVERDLRHRPERQRLDGAIVAAWRSLIAMAGRSVAVAHRSAATLVAAGSPAERALAEVARSVTPGIECVVLREADTTLDAHDVDRAITLARLLAIRHRLVVVLSLRDVRAAARADRLIDLSPVQRRVIVS